jgi:lipopolysaccharide transport system ATP-binding protein
VPIHPGCREFHALLDVSFEIRKGESWGFIGVNGSGKSTLLKIISGNLRPSTGCVEVDGKVVILDYGSGFNSEFTGEENIYLKAALLGLTKRQINERFQSIVEFAELGEFIKQPTKTYSSGMNARLGFAIMAHVDADIIITDEALAVGDVFFVQKCMAYIRSFLKRGTFLFVSHSMNDVLSLCQHAIWLEHGKIRAIGSAQATTNAYLGTQELARADSLAIEEEKPREAEAVNVSELVLNQPILAELMNYKVPRVIRDLREKYFNQSTLRNDIQVPEFVFDTVGFGAGGARILNVAFSDEEGSLLSWIVGGELVTLTIEVRAERDLPSPIVGFQLLDRLGQSLIADNSFLVTRDRVLRVVAGTSFTAEFVFQMPLLPVGEYVIRAAVALGEDESTAVPLHIVDAALVIRSTASGARHGLVGVPMHAIRIRCKDPAET